MSEHFHSIFRRSTGPAARAKFLSRIFGIFSEEIVSLWAHDDRAPFERLSRPTIKTPKENRGHTLDFTLRDRINGKVFVAEMKCEIECQGYRYFILERVEQLAHHKKPAFDALLKVAVQAPDQEVYVAGNRITTDGAILIWGSATEEGRRAVIESKGFHAVLTIAEICRDLVSWDHAGYRALVAQRRECSNELFTGLLKS